MSPWLAFYWRRRRAHQCVQCGCGSVQAAYCQGCQAARREARWKRQQRQGAKSGKSS